MLFRSSLPKCSAVVLYRLPKQRVIDLAGEDLISEFELTDLGPTEIDYIDVCHRSSLFAPVIDATGQNFICPGACFDRVEVSYFFFGAAFLEAFNASFVAAPANPRRSLGGALAFEINT